MSVTRDQDIIAGVLWSDKELLGKYVVLRFLCDKNGEIVETNVMAVCENEEAFCKELLFCHTQLTTKSIEGLNIFFSGYHHTEENSISNLKNVVLYDFYV